MALNVGDMAPDFELPRTMGEGDTVRLGDFNGKKNVLLFFSPFDFSPVCSKQLPAYQSQAAKFEKAHCQVLGTSVDSPFSHAAWAEKYGIQFPLLSDFFSKGTVEAYGLLNDMGFSNRALVLIDKEGRVVHLEVTPSPPEMPDDSKLFTALVETGLSGQIGSGRRGRRLPRRFFLSEGRRTLYRLPAESGILFGGEVFYPE